MSYPSGEPAQYPSQEPGVPVDPAPQDLPQPEPVSPAPGFDEKGRVKNSRVSGVWIGLIGTALFLILLIVFVAQNSRRVSIHFFGWHGQFSLALTILLSAVIGVLLVALPGTVRILQLRSALRKNGPGRG
jgi:uncharacterized integral membrane protein